MEAMASALAGVFGNFCAACVPRLVASEESGGFSVRANAALFLGAGSIGAGGAIASSLPVSGNGITAGAATTDASETRSSSTVYSRLLPVPQTFSTRTMAAGSSTAFPPDSRSTDAFDECCSDTFRGLTSSWFRLMRPPLKQRSSLSRASAPMRGTLAFNCRPSQE